LGWVISAAFFGLLFFWVFCDVVGLCVGWEGEAGERGPGGREERED